MSELTNINLPEDPYSVFPSSGFIRLLNSSDANDPSPELSIFHDPPNPCHKCGCGHEPCGAPGERQVNSTNEDINRKPRVTQSETSLARFRNFILFGFNDSNIPGNFSGFAFSSDCGINWTDGGNLPQNPPWQNGGDPVIAVDSHGIFYYAELGVLPNTEVGIIQISTGVVNPQTKRITMNTPFVAGEGTSPTNFEDKEWMAVGPDPSRGKFAEAIYLTWTDFSNNGTAIRFSKWVVGVTPTVLIASKTISPDNNVSGSFPVIGPDGTIYVFYEQITSGVNRVIRMVKSTDGGTTFSPPTTVANLKIAANNVLGCGRPAIQVTPTKTIRSNEFPHAAIGPDGMLYVVFNSGTGNTLPQPAINIYLAYSRDKGVTWVIRQITGNTAYAFMPSVIADNRGAHIQYSRFDGTSGVGNGRFALFMRTFNIRRGLSAERMVSTVFSLVPDTNPNFDPGVANCYMGDYNQIIRGPGCSLYHGWGDNRNDIYNGNNPDVFFIQTGR
ncbi:sialidase family protein [Clostridium sp. 'White wine YQ']|uniref:sialidase family protein n=1 Tax=Clostridium sp. 'White wine YQ' TaxID=3027474 RepID=UPI0023666D95|nr:sialidase family protein [Clostridium sp. 'White wine YQ']MDD7794377.1 sialidase family protein [Clostridium sp. 'White wine YQ']